MLSKTLKTLAGGFECCYEFAKYHDYFVKNSFFHIRPELVAVAELVAGSWEAWVRHVRVLSGGASWIVCGKVRLGVRYITFAGSYCGNV
jgi:hypothetical protein